MIWNGWFRRKRWEEKLDAELRFHIDQQIQNYIQSGDSPEEARRKALLDLGGLDQIKEECRDSRKLSYLDALWRNARYGLRLLTNNPKLAVVAVLSLALPIAVSTAVFSLLYAVVLKALPFADQERIVVAWKTDRATPERVQELSYLEYKDWQEQSDSFEELAALPTTVYGYSYIMTGRGEAREIESVRATHNLFSVLGVSPHLGRLFQPEDDRVGAAPVVILTHRFWQDAFSSDPNVVGSSVLLNEVAYSVIGVLPLEFQFPQGADVFTPVATNGIWVKNRRAVFLQVIGRLKPGVPIPTVKAELDTILARLAAQYPDTADTGQTAGEVALVTPIAEYITGTTKPVMLFLFLGSVALLAVACINLAGLLSTRAISRSAEIAVRKALGASRAALFLQFLTEGAVLALCGSAIGIGLFPSVLRTLRLIAPKEIPRIEAAGMDASTLAFALGCLLVTTILFGFTSLAVIREQNLHAALKSTGRRLAGPSSWGTKGLVVAEVAATFVLLIVAGLIGRSFLRLQSVPLGYGDNDVFTAAVTLSQTKYQDPATRRAFFRELLGRLESHPNVIAAGAILIRPLEGSIGWDRRYSLPGQSLDEAKANPVVNYEVVTPSYFRAVGTPILAGRTFDDGEDTEKLRVAIVSESVAARMYGSASEAVGKRFVFGPPTGNLVLWEIVGVVADARYRSLRQVTGDIFLSYEQSNVPVRYLIVRTRGDASSMSAIVQRSIAEIDHTQASSKHATMRVLAERAIANERFHSRLLAFFGLSALFLASLGVYGLISDLAAKRTREIGIRIALGAGRASVLKLFLAEGLLLALTGIGVGLFISIAVGRAIASLLYDVAPIDPVTFIAVPLLLLGIASLASYIPAARATRIDPMLALRSD